jgi:hypothetical protein
MQVASFAISVRYLKQHTPSADDEKKARFCDPSVATSRKESALSQLKKRHPRRSL